MNHSSRLRRKRHTGRLIVFFLLALTQFGAGCNAFGVLGNPQSNTWFSLGTLTKESLTPQAAQASRTGQLAQSAKDADSHPPLPHTLIVGEAGSNPFYNSTQIAYSRSDIARAYYQFSSWTERPAKRISVLLEQALVSKARFAAVADQSAGVVGDMELNFFLEELYHDAAGKPQFGRILVRVDLVDRKRRTMIARQRFAAKAPVQFPDAANAVRAMAQATVNVVDEISDWAAEQAGSLIQPAAKVSTRQ